MRQVRSSRGAGRGRENRACMEQRRAQSACAGNASAWRNWRRSGPPRRAGHRSAGTAGRHRGRGGEVGMRAHHRHELPRGRRRRARPAGAASPADRPARGLGRAAAAAQPAEQRHRRLVARSGRALQATALQANWPWPGAPEDSVPAAADQSPGSARNSACPRPGGRRPQLRQSVEGCRVRRQRQPGVQRRLQRGGSHRRAQRDAPQALRDPAELEPDETSSEAWWRQTTPVEDEQRWRSSSPRWSRCAAGGAPWAA